MNMEKNMYTSIWVIIGRTGQMMKKNATYSPEITVVCFPTFDFDDDCFSSVVYELGLLIQISEILSYTETGLDIPVVCFSR